MLHSLRVDHGCHLWQKTCDAFF